MSKRITKLQTQAVYMAAERCELNDEMSCLALDDVLFRGWRCDWHEVTRRYREMFKCDEFNHIKNMRSRKARSSLRVLMLCLFAEVRGSYE